MTYTLTRIPTLTALLLVLFSIIYFTQSNSNTFFLTEETATSTVPFIETGETSTTTEPIATTTPEVLILEVASSTASTTDTEPLTSQSESAPSSDDWYPRTPIDCHTLEGRSMFVHPGECMRAIHRGIF